jgi:carboxyl-terminal processing protease
MRFCLWIGGWSGLLLGTVLAAPAERRPVPREAARGAAVDYATELLRISSLITQEYAREVRLADLLATGVVGLYEATRVPLPPRLRANIASAAPDDAYEQTVLAYQAIADQPGIQGPAGLLASLNALPRILDPHTGLIYSQDFRPPASDLEFGTGLEFAVGNELGVNLAEAFRQRGGELTKPRVPAAPPFRIESVAPGSPAQRAGLRPGDLLTHVDDAAITPALARVLVEGEQPAQLSVRGQRPRGGPLVLRLTPGSYVTESVFGTVRNLDNTWSHWLDRPAGIGYLRIGFIKHQTPTEVLGALERLRGEGCKGLIFDLRGCPGGYLSEAAYLARIFLKTGTIATVKDRVGQITSLYRADNLMGNDGLPRPDAPVALSELPLVVLINATTSGGGELIAAALGDNDRALLVGQRTVGKASVQTARPLESLPGLSLRISTGTFVRPNGQAFQRFADSTTWGVDPSPGQQVPLTPDLVRQLTDWRTLHALRPGHSKEALPLDDSENDPQQQAALNLLRKRLRAGK